MSWCPTLFLYFFCYCFTICEAVNEFQRKLRTVLLLVIQSLTAGSAQRSLNITL